MQYFKDLNTHGTYFYEKNYKITEEQSVDLYNDSNSQKYTEGLNVSKIQNKNEPEQTIKTLKKLTANKQPSYIRDHNQK